MVNVLALGFNAARVAMGHTDSRAHARPRSRAIRRHYRQQPIFHGDLFLSKARHLRARGRQAQHAPPAADAPAPASAAGIQAFSFGDPTPVLEHADILDCF